MKDVVIIGALLVLGACKGDDAALPSVTAISPDGARHASPSYSPDGKRMAWWAPATDSSADWQLWVGRADLSAAVTLPVSSFFPALVAWSPDGARIAAMSSQYGTGDIIVVPSAGGGKSSD